MTAMNEKRITLLGYFAALMTTLMFGSYVDQIRLNLSGMKGSVILPIFTMISTALWIAYALLKTKKDWPIVVCNAVGFLLGLATFLTSV